MKCTNCNAEVPDGQRFCGNCGKEIKTTDFDFSKYPIPMEIIDKFIESSDDKVEVRLLNDNAPLSSKMKEADRVVNKAYQHFDKAYPVLFKYGPKKRLWIKWLVIFLILLAAFIFFFIKRNDESFASYMVRDLSMSLTYLFGLVAFVIFIISIIISAFASYKCKIATKEKLEGVHILKTHEYNLRCLPEDYLNPLATGYLVKITANNRVTNLSDALDRCDAYIRHNQLQNQLNEMNRNINYLRAETSRLQNSVDFWGALNYLK